MSASKRSASATRRSTKRQTFTALKPKWRDHLKEIRFQKSGRVLVVPRSACVTEGDAVFFTTDGAFAQCKNGMVQLSPSYLARERIVVGRFTLDLLVKEITEADEFDDYLALTRYHYRGRILCGRTARLIVRNFDPTYPKVVGYVELATPFYMNKARSRVFDAPFEAPGIAWTKWNQESLRRGIHTIVRIARCVVFPEFRGVGLGQVLIKHAVRFASDRWQMRGMKPLFLEISADMLRFVPFAEKAGMIYIGETEGNLRRVAEDMTYLVTNSRRVRAGRIVKEEACGIVDQQVSRMNRALGLMRDHGWSVKDLASRLKKCSGDPSLRDYHLFSGILSLPKPTYSLGLTVQAHRFLKRRVQELGVRNGKVPQLPQVKPFRGMIRLRGVEVKYDSHVRRTEKTHAIEQAFGISPEGIGHPVIDDLHLNVASGEVVLVTGPSGSGKTSLMQLLSKASPNEGSIGWPLSAQVGHFRPLRSQKPLIDALGVASVDAALHLMGIVGLSDAYVYLKRFEELSNGQQYRAMLANLIAGGANVWLADEFCANLDSITANVVADGLQRIARQLGAALIVASSQPHVFAAALRPDHVLQLTTGNGHAVSVGSAFLAGLGPSTAGGRMPAFRVSGRELRGLRKGRVRLMLLRGTHIVSAGLSIVNSAGQSEIVRVLGSDVTNVKDLTRAQAQQAGFGSLSEMRRWVARTHHRLGDQGCVTLVAAELFETLHPKKALANR